MKKRLFLIFIILVSVSTNIAKAESEMQVTNRMMIDCINNQLCYKANASLDEVYVYDGAWQMATIDQKKNIASFFYAYVKARNNIAQQVYIKSAYTGKKIAEYSPFWGYKEK